MDRNLKKQIKVFIIEDSPVALKILKRVLESSQDIKIVGTANNGVAALEQIPLLKPDLICTDLVMSKMDGLEFTKTLMSTFPLPILVISESVNTNDNKKITQLKEAGVLDIFPKPETGFIQDYEKQANSLISKIKILAGVKVFTKRNPNQQTNPLTSKNTITINSLEVTSPERPKVFKPNKNLHYQVIGIGMSTGGPKAIEQILKQLPANFPLPIICTQHISTGFLSGLITSLNLATALQVKIAQIGETPQPGIVYFAPENYHLEIRENKKFAYSSADPVDNHRPSATVMLNSLAQFYGNTTVGIILTGMGRDGAAGMAEVKQKGGLTIAQDEASSIIFGMPKEAIKLGVVEQIMPLSSIAPFLIEQVKISTKIS